MMERSLVHNTFVVGMQTITVIAIIASIFDITFLLTDSTQAYLQNSEK